MQTFVERDAEPELIGGGVGAAGLELLGRHVRGRAEHRAGLRDERVFRLEARHAEVREQQAPPRRDQHVRRLHVAVHDAGGVRGAERVGQERADARDELRQDRSSLLDLCEERAPADELHHDERRIAPRRAADVVDPQDVRVLEPRRRARLALEPPHDLVAPREVREQHLDRDLAAELGVARAEHRRHAALADLLVERVAPERVARVHEAHARRPLRVPRRRFAAVHRTETRRLRGGDRRVLEPAGRLRRLVRHPAPPR